MHRVTTCRSRLTGTLLAIVMCSASVSASPFGINGHTPDDAIADRIAEAGIGWVRIDLLWSVVEPERDLYEWGFYDDLIDRLETRGLRILANFHDTPTWATSGPAFSGVPADPDEVQELLYLASLRYRGRIHAWGLWNEPNLDRFWVGSRAAYIETVLLPGIAGLEAGDPDALITAPDTAHLSSGLWWYWLEDVISAAGDRLDVVTHHVYPGSDASAFEVSDDLNEAQRYPWEDESVREILEWTGWFGRPFWLTETGVESARSGNLLQAEFYEDLLGQWYGPAPVARWVDRMFFYEIHDPPPPQPYSFGILFPPPELVRKPSFFAYQDFIVQAEVDDAEIVSHPPWFHVPEGATGVFELALRNTGSTIWRGAEGYGLEVAVDGPTWLPGPWLLELGFDVGPGEVVTFEVPVEAPDFGGIDGRSLAMVSARMVDGTGEPFGELFRQRVVASQAQPVDIVRQPRSVTVLEGRTAVLSVEAQGSGELRYRWRRNSLELADGGGYSGTQSPRLTVHDIEERHSGWYDCVISNRAGDVVTDPVELEIGDVPPRRSGPRRLPAEQPGKGLELVPAP